MGLELKFHVSDDESGSRLDRSLTDWLDQNEEIPPISRSHLQKLIRDGAVLLNHRPATKSKTLRGGDIVSISFREPEKLEVSAEDIPIDIVYEDADLVVVNKPAGMVVHPAPGHPRGTLVNALMHHCPDLGDIGGTVRPGIVHRLDKGTTGLIVVAKHGRSMEAMSKAFLERRIKKTYRALVQGQPSTTGKFETLFSRHPTDRLKFTSKCTRGKNALTTYQLNWSVLGFSDVEIDLGTGRTHQIRVHFSEHGYPLLGDPLYRANWQPQRFNEMIRSMVASFSRPALHAWKLAFQHPISGEYLELEAPLPGDMVSLMTVGVEALELSD